MSDPPKPPTSRFEYIHDTLKWPPRMVDIHQVQVPNRTGSVLSALWVPFLVAILSSSLFMGLLNQVILSSFLPFVSTGYLRFFDLGLNLGLFVGMVVMGLWVLIVFGFDDVVTGQDGSVGGVACGMIVVGGVGLVRLLRRRIVEKESVVIIPAFGVQLETQYRSGRVVRRFVHCNSILKPVLNECVTPVTCYWSLALILRDEDDLMLVFEELRPPLNMLVPIWKALCAGIEGKNCEANKSDLKEQ